MKCGIAPSILSFELTDLRNPVQQMMEAGAAWIHLDVMDGHFVPPITVGPSFVQSLRSVGSTPFEAHLMIGNPERQFEAFAEAGCQRIIFHAEATDHAYRHAQNLRSLGLSPGVAINPGTAVASVQELLEIVDLVLVMTVNPGWGGQKFIQSALEKVRLLRSLRADLEIEVDGGIDLTTLPLAKEAGANLFVVGSYLQRQPDLPAALQRMVELCG